MRINLHRAALLLFAGMLGCGSGGGSSTDPKTTLAGTWQITGSAGSAQPQTATLNWSASSFSFVYHSTTVTMTRAGDAMTISWTKPSGTSVLVQATHSGGVNVGAIPFNPTGDWIFSSNDPNNHGRCMASATTDSLANACTGFTPHVLALSPFDGTVTAHRTQAGSSIFGELGGSWSVAIGTAGSCNVNFVGSTFTATCVNAGRLTGSASVTVIGDMASGTVGRSEFSAQRQ